MPDVIINAKVGISGVNNGSLVTFAQDTGKFEKLNPLVNSYVPSGTMNQSLVNRFLLDYGGGPS